MNQPKERPGRIDLIASGYEWICPDCEELQDEVDSSAEQVTCYDCGLTLTVGNVLHAK